MKIVINRCYGGFGLSEKAIDEYAKLSGKDDFKYYDIARDDPILVDIVERLGNEASDSMADIQIIEIPDDVTDWHIFDYDGMETIGEGRTWPKED